MSGFVRVVQDLGLLVARIVLGGILVLHGWLRWQGPGQGVPRQIDYLTQFATPYPEVVAWGAIVLEIVGGIFLIFGALTPLVALAVVVEQVLIISYTNWYTYPQLLDLPGQRGLEYNLTLAALALLFVVFGAGRIAVDQVFRKAKPEPEADTASTTTANRTASTLAA